MNAEFINAAASLIEKFGFPVFVALVGLAFVFIIVRYFIKTIETTAKTHTTAIEKKDCDFLEYAKNRDAQIFHIVSSHNEVSLKTVEAVNGLKNSIDIRINREIRKDWEQETTKNEANKHEVTVA